MDGITAGLFNGAWILCRLPMHSLHRFHTKKRPQQGDEKHKQDFLSHFFHSLILTFSAYDGNFNWEYQGHARFRFKRLLEDVILRL